MWEKAALPALSLGCTWEAPSSSCGDTHIQTYMPALVLTSIYIYMFVQELDLLVGWGSRKWGDAVLALSGRAGCRLSPLESFDPRYQRAGVTRLPSSL